MQSESEKLRELRAFVELRQRLNNVEWRARNDHTFAARVNEAALILAEIDRLLAPEGEDCRELIQSKTMPPDEYHPKPYTLLFCNKCGHRAEVKLK
jgi:hypothetical protein